MQTFGSAASVVAAIREEAAAEVEKIEQTTSAEVAGINEEAKTKSVVIADRDEQLSAARRANQERLAQREWDGRRAVIEQREAWIVRVLARAHELWRGGDRSQLQTLMREAVALLGDEHCEIAVAAIDRETIEKAKLADIAGGCIVTAGDIVFDNSFEARARRLEAQWRNALAGMYKP